MKCIICGKEFEHNFYNKGSEFYEVCGDLECFENRFWDITLDGNEFIIDGECYHVGKEPTKLDLELYRDSYGFGGREFRIKKFDIDEVIITHNLRDNGKVPDDRNIQDNAEFFGCKKW